MTTLEHVDELLTKLEFHEAIQQLRADLGIPSQRRKLAQSVEPDSSGTATIVLGRPSVATRWDLRSLTVLGEGDSTQLHAATSPQGLSDLSVLWDSQDPLPWSYRWGEQVFISDSEALILVVSGASGPITATASVWEVPA